MTMCRRPITLSNGQIVECGQCYDCRKKKARALREKLDSAIAENNGVAVFMTFTFSDEHLDYAYNYAKLAPSYRFPYRTKWEWQESPVEKMTESLVKHYDLFNFRRYFATRLRLERVPEASEIETVFYRYWKHGTDTQKAECERLRYLFPAYSADAAIPCFPLFVDQETGHVQDSWQRFMRRLRNKTDKRIQFQAVQEYGPLTFRPHWHAVMWLVGVSKEENESFMKTVAKPLWEEMYGHCDYAETVREPHATSTYVSKYISKPESQLNPYAEVGMIPRADCFRHHSENFGHAVKDKLCREAQAVLNRYSDVIPTEPKNFVPSQKVETVEAPIYQEVNPFGDTEFQGHYQFTNYENISDYLERCEADYFALMQTREGELFEGLYNVCHYWIMSSAGTPLCQVSWNNQFQTFWPTRAKRFRVEESERMTVFDELESYKVRIYQDNEEGNFKDDLPITEYLDSLVYPRFVTVKDTAAPLWRSYVSYSELRSLARLADSIRDYINTRYDGDAPAIPFEDFMDEFRRATFAEKLQSSVSSEHWDECHREQAIFWRKSDKILED